MTNHQPPSSEARTQRKGRPGTVMPIGGAEEDDPGNHQTIVGEFVRQAGGKRARIVVIPTAGSDPASSGDAYCKLFMSLGVKSSETLMIEKREDANQETTLALFDGATGIFITGGDQARLVSLLVGTAVMEAIRRCHEDGAVVAGTSAGASILSAHMMVPGAMDNIASNDATPRKGQIELVSGFGLLSDVIIDQHFSQRGRIGRLLDAFAGNPGLLGLGIDEDTAAVIVGLPEPSLTVIGTGAVTILDGRNATSDYFDRSPGEVVSIFDSHIFVLGAGRQFDLVTRRPLPVTTEAGITIPGA